jgi:hypothetical protein
LRSLRAPWWLVSSFRRNFRTLDAVEDAKNRLWSRAGREAFIASPRGEWSDLFDLAMDSMAKHATLHDRKQVRASLQVLLPDQIRELRQIATDELATALKDLSSDASLVDLKKMLAQRISGEFIDAYAEREGEQIENSVGLRSALIQWCVGEVTNVDISEYDESEMTGMLACVCPECDRVMRDITLLRAASVTTCSSRSARIGVLLRPRSALCLRCDGLAVGSLLGFL